MQSAVYTCPACKATKTIQKAYHQSSEEFAQRLPNTLPCGWRGCDDRCLPAADVLRLMFLTDTISEKADNGNHLQLYP